MPACAGMKMVKRLWNRPASGEVPKFDHAAISVMIGQMLDGMLPKMIVVGIEK